MARVIIVAVVISALAFCAAVSSTRNLNGMQIGNDFYFVETSNAARTRAAAQQYCESQEANLARIENDDVYLRLRVSLSILGIYWIDGMDRVDSSRFALNTTCKPGTLNVNPHTMDLPIRSCLALVKGSTQANTRIRAIDCNTQGVICSISLNGCPDATPSSTLAPSP